MQTQVLQRSRGSNDRLLRLKKCTTKAQAERCYQHWVEFGRAEGRSSNPDECSVSKYTCFNGITTLSVSTRMDKSPAPQKTHRHAMQRMEKRKKRSRRRRRVKKWGTRGVGRTARGGTARELGQNRAQSALRFQMVPSTYAQRRTTLSQTTGVQLQRRNCWLSKPPKKAFFFSFR